MKKKGKEFEAKITSDDCTLNWFTADLKGCIIEGFHLIIEIDFGSFDLEVTALQLAMDQKVIERNDDLLEGYLKGKGLELVDLSEYELFKEYM